MAAYQDTTQQDQYCCWFMSLERNILHECERHGTESEVESDTGSSSGGGGTN